MSLCEEYAHTRSTCIQGIPVYKEHLSIETIAKVDTCTISVILMHLFFGQPLYTETTTVRQLGDLYHINYNFLGMKLSQIFDSSDFYIL